MTKARFLHVADVHLDSPLNRIRRLNQSMADRMQGASRRSFEAVVDVALEREVCAVLIAGDLFDGPVRDASAGLWVESQFKRLTSAGIQVVLILGNHDAVSGAGRASRWASGVVEFGDKQASSVVIDSAGVVVHGQSFGAREQTADLAAKYPRPLSGLFNVGLLHTSLSGSGTHDTYAPTSLPVLENSGYEYWALGHVHTRNPDSLSQRCFVGYAGNTQGRSIREVGAKGCYCVEIQDCELQTVEFVPTDCLRWQQLKLDISPAEHLRDIEDLLETHANWLLNSAEGRSLALRITLQGATPLHAELSRPGAMDNICDSLAARLADMGDFWLESIKLDSGPHPGRSSDDVLLPLKYLERISLAARQDALVRQQMEGLLEELLKKARHELSEYGWSLSGQAGQAEFDRLLSRAEGMLAARLLGDEAA